MKKYLTKTTGLIALAIMFALGASAAFAATGSTTTTSYTKGSLHHSQIQPGVGGTITAISGTTITISGREKNKSTTYTIDASAARFEGFDIKTITDLKVGDTIEAVGTVSSLNVTAKLVFVRPASLGSPKSFKGLSLNKSQINAEFTEISGTIQTVSGNTVTILGSRKTTYTVNATKAFVVDSKHKKGSVSDLVVGDSVRVFGKPGANADTITAIGISDNKTF